MFCLNCGQQLPDGSAFCPSCGTSLANSVEQQVQQNAQQPQQYAQQYTQQAQEYAQQAQEFAQQPQQFAQQPQQYTQQPQQFAQQAQEFAQQPQQFAQQAQEFAQQPQQFAQQPQQFAQQAQEFAQQPQQFAQQPQQFAQQVQQPVYDAGNVTVPKPKKKSKKGLAIGLGCGGAAVAAAAAVTVFVVKPNENPAVLRTFMGDQGYAKSVQDTYIDGLMDEGKQYTGLLSSVGQAAGKIAKRQTASLNNYDSYSALSEKYDYQKLTLANALYSYVDLADQPDNKNITIVVSVNAEIGDSLKSLMREYIPNFSSMEGQIDSIISGINGLEIKAAQSAADDGYSLYLSASGDGSEIGGVAMNLKKSGELKVCFPGLVDAVITAQIPSYDEMGLGEVTTAAAAAMPQVDADKVDALARKIADAYYSCYEFADVKYSDENITFGTETEKCTVITVTMDDKAIAKVFGKVADVIESEGYVDELITAFGLSGSYYGDENVKGQIVQAVRSAAQSLEAAVDQMPEGSEQFIKLVTENYVNGRNECLGSKFRLSISGVEYFRLESIDNGKYMDLRLSVYNQSAGDVAPLFSISGSHTETSGDLDIVVDLSSLSSLTPMVGVRSTGAALNGKKIAINVNYSDKKKFTAFGQEMLGGTYRISIKDASLFEGMDSKIYDVIKDAQITLSLGENEGGVKSTIGLSAGSYGSLTLNYAIIPKAEIPAISGSKTYDLNTLDSDQIQGLVNELMESLKGKAESNSLIKTIMDTFIAPMTGYIDASKVTSADSTAATLKNTFNIFVTEMDTKNAGIKRTKDTYEFVLTVSGSDISFTSDDTAQVLNKNALEYNGGSNGSEWLAAFAKKIGDYYDFTDASAWFYVKNGMCVGVAYYAGYAGSYFEHPHAYDFENDKYNWGGDMDGVTASDEIIGTCPKLADDDYWDNNAYQEHLPKKGIVLEGIYYNNTGYITFSGNVITIVTKDGGRGEGTFSVEDDVLSVVLNGRTDTYTISVTETSLFINGEEFTKTSTIPDYGNNGNNGNNDNNNDGTNTPLYGNYMATDEDAYFTFDGNQVSFTVSGYTLSGTYTISDGMIHITYDIYGSELKEDYSFKQSGDSIFIEGQEYKHAM